MRTFENFNDYELIDADNGERLERWGDIILIRPDPQIIWSEGHRDDRWNKAHAIYHRSNSGGGYWETLKKVPDVWSINYEDLTFRLKPMGFKHTGLFPEQAVNWSLAQKLIKEANREVSVLNLFAYTGGATIACLNAGARVTHVDASKGMVSWAKENAVASALADRPVRWLVDDCMKFVKREIRRGNKYDAIIMDPPSYGRGPNGEVWKLEQQLSELLTDVGKILSDDPLFFFLNSYTGGLSPTILNYMVKSCIAPKNSGTIFTEEIGIKVTKRDVILPCGNTTIWMK
ncbi:MAG: class I SAM-dependent methyltransferase [Clostridia bacterium]|nr:class I SAM-dependent methyltransferase [Clostridia bacterium]MBR3591907.1 class I SAM-dependent methyltransferase [Clostridia bacterium]MBR4116862.1 class I SAM-dependent methyltransferase [Clostridia bacterium]